MTNFLQLANDAQGETLIARMVDILANGLDPDYIEPGVRCEPLPSAYVDRKEWLARYFPHAAYFPNADHHEEIWDWLEDLQPGVRPQPLVAVLARGGGKSTTVELGVTRIGAKLTRRFALIVSATQEQADSRVQAIAAHFEKLNVERAVNKFGHAKGWRRDQLRVANGFNVAGLGLDVSVRGIKLDEFRPDIIVIDDVDNHSDTLIAVEKKIAILTKSVLPAGTADLAVLAVQNLVWEESIFSRLAHASSTPADFLLDRRLIGPIPAINGFRCDPVRQSDGKNLYRITEGEAVWAGQSIETCESYINTYGLKSFLEEMQHEVASPDGFVFATSRIPSIDPQDVPPLVAVRFCWDLAATEGGGDWTVGALMGRAENQTYYILGVIRGQWSSERVNAAIHLSTAAYRSEYPDLQVHVPQDPGQAGKAMAQQMRREFAEHDLKTSLVGRRGKIDRGRKFVDECNKGNVYLVRKDLPDALDKKSGQGLIYHDLKRDKSWQDWHMRLLDEFRRFREDEPNQLDDQYDAATDAYNLLVKRRKGRISQL